jgi:hypothetical protein
LIGTVLFIVEGTQRAALTGANDADITTVLNGFLDEGLDETSNKSLSVADYSAAVTTAIDDMPFKPFVLGSSPHRPIIESM